MPGKKLRKAKREAERKRLDLIQGERSISVLAAEEQANVSRNLKLLADSYPLISLVELMYDSLPPMCRFPADAATNKPAHAAGISAHLMWICRRQFTVGMLTLLRGYRVDSLAHLRKAVELCAFAVKMTKHPEMSYIWIQANDSDEARDKFRDKFVKLFPKDDRELQVLEKFFDEASEAMHSNARSVAHYLSLRRRVEGFPNVGVFDIGSDAVFISYFIRFVDCHITILDTFLRCLKKYARNTKEWQKQLRNTKVQLTVEHKKWQPLIQALWIGSPVRQLQHRRV
jgi:hypothetical protein